MSEIKHEDTVIVVNDLMIKNRETGSLEVLASAGTELEVVGVSKLAVGEQEFVSLYLSGYGTIITPSDNVKLKEVNP